MTPLWMALVWAVHALVVMLEWCFTIDLLDSSADERRWQGPASDAGGLHRTVAAGGLAVASVLALYHGLSVAAWPRRSARRC